MRTFQVKQKLRLGGERFDIKDENETVAYQVEGSLMAIPKRFTVYQADHQVVSTITTKLWSLLPQFLVKMADGQEFVIKKHFTFWQDKYTLENFGLTLKGNIWDLNFSLLDDDGNVIAEISKELWHLTSTYTVTVYNDAFADLVISLVVALDYVEVMEN